MAVGEVCPAVRAAKKAVFLNQQWWIGHQTLGRALLGMGQVNAVNVIGIYTVRATVQRRNGIWVFHGCNVWNEMPGAGHRVPYFAAVKDPNPVNGRAVKNHDF